MRYVQSHAIETDNMHLLFMVERAYIYIFFQSQLWNNYLNILEIIGSTIKNNDQVDKRRMWIIKFTRRSIIVLQIRIVAQLLFI